MICFEALDLQFIFYFSIEFALNQNSHLNSNSKLNHPKLWLRLNLLLMTVWYANFSIKTLNFIEEKCFSNLMIYSPKITQFAM